ncbi:HalOD1 output domain-containing protein (plasmid) [Haloarcula sp. NS06]|uniref:HalOD1 output domain-containing protein n=1 Tax=Haloarcula sp. NS06 TaxID=3409688 RepID=UPI003DA74DA0
MKGCLFYICLTNVYVLSAILREYGRNKWGLSERIVCRVATTTNSDVTELPPLHDSIDPNALETTVERMSDGAISFRYAGYEVTVAQDGAISLEEQPTGTTASELAMSDD